MQKLHKFIYEKYPSMNITSDQRRLMQDVFLTSYATLLGPAPDMLTDLVRKGLVEWHWNGGVPIYEITDAGREALKTSKQT